MTYIVEVEEDGTLTLPHDILGDAKPRTRYVVEAQGDRLVLHPEAEKAAVKTLSSEEWWEQWKALSAAVSRASITNESAVDILSEMRR